MRFSSSSSSSGETSGSCRALAATMFLGGWQVPFFPAERLDALTGWPRGSSAEIASHRLLRRQDPLLRLRGHVDPLDAAAHPRRSDDEHVLEVPGAGELRGRALRRPAGCCWCTRRRPSASPCARCSPRRRRRGLVMFVLRVGAQPARHRRQVRLHVQLVIENGRDQLLRCRPPAPWARTSGTCAAR